MTMKTVSGFRTVRYRRTPSRAIPRARTARTANSVFTCISGSLSAGQVRARSSVVLHKIVKRADDVLEGRMGKAGVDANPERPVHHEVRAGEISNSAVRDSMISRLPQEVSGEDEP